MNDNLSFEQLAALLESVFGVREHERALALLVDLPDDRLRDSAAWRDRRDIAAEWFRLLYEHRDRLPFTDVLFCAYAHVGSNNNDLPADTAVARTPAQQTALPAGARLPLETIFAASSVVISLTELSATAPLKLLARKHGFRGATMPGFSRAMLPVLALDYERVNARVLEFRDRMDRADGAAITLDADATRHDCFFDLRFRTGHASGGLMREPGMVGNLPSGEAYIVPYEGERDGEPSLTAGTLPVQFDDEIVVYRIDGNRAVDVLSDGPRAARERQQLAAEPAYGNMAEVGIGVLGEWGVQAVGSTLLDEKLGLHIAFGRSDHFGGITSPASFRSHDAVVHIDRVYVPSTQPRIRVAEVAFVYADGSRETIIRGDAYVV